MLTPDELHYYKLEYGLAGQIDFLLEMDLDLAEFTVLTPFAHTPIREQLERENRILSNDLSLYDAAHVVFRPARMAPGRLQEMYHWAWETFYRDEPQAYKMYRLHQRLAPANAKGGGR